MRETNNDKYTNVISHSDENVSAWFVIYDIGTKEYLTRWEVYEARLEEDLWEELDLESDSNERDRFDMSVMFHSYAKAEKLLLEVAEHLTERFPEERIDLQVRKLIIRTTRTVDIEDVGETQTFGHDEEWEAEQEEEEEEDEGEDYSYRGNIRRTSQSYVNLIKDSAPKKKGKKAKSTRKRG